ncbi:MAG: isochorismatase family protein [Nitriliruptorales bacterium]|nr:isochorismatase family protein [Nitriliruptorales bacterium]
MVDLSDVMSERDQAVFAASGYGARAGFGQRPVILVIDVNYNFCGHKREPILESMRTWRNSCGEAAWDAVEHIQRLLAVARSRGIPIIYSTAQDPRPDGFDSGRWADKNSRRAEDRLERSVPGNAIVAPIAPQPQDIVIRKGKPSVFFGTLLNSYLVDLQADSIIACGTSTSGCVRGTVIDGFSNNYRMSVVEECTFDRGELSHRVNLFDMDQKYADVVGIDETVTYLESLPRDLFVDRLSSLRPAAPVA